MKAHKVPATYLVGWEIPTLKDRIYVFDKSNLSKPGITKRFRDVDKITTEHSYFMEEDFYYIDLRIEGIDYKLRKEISDFLSQNLYAITCEDDLAEIADGEPRPIVSINTFDMFHTYKENMHTWMITDSSGATVHPDVFKAALNKYIFDRVGVIVEENYFANTLETKWNDVRDSIISDAAGHNSGDPIVLSRKKELLEFYTIQYLRVNKRYNDIIPVLDMIKRIFSEMGLSSVEISNLEQDGLLSPRPYFYGILLDSARGDKDKVNNTIDTLDKEFSIDVLKATSGKSFLTSTSPCITTKTDISGKTEMIFPLTSQYCIRFQKSDSEPTGKYYELTDDEVKNINAAVIADSTDIIFSEKDNTAHLL